MPRRRRRERAAKRAHARLAPVGVLAVEDGGVTAPRHLRALLAAAGVRLRGNAAPAH